MTPIATTIVQIDAIGGAVSDIAASATAFPHRSMTALIQYQANWNDPHDAERARAWIADIFGAVDPHTAKASYRNYTDANLKGWAHRYYESNYPRLQKIKRTLDPENRFRPWLVKGLGTYDEWGRGAPSDSGWRVGPKGWLRS